VIWVAQQGAGRAIAYARAVTRIKQAHRHRRCRRAEDDDVRVCGRDGGSVPAGTGRLTAMVSIESLTRPRDPDERGSACRSP